MKRVIFVLPKIQEDTFINKFFKENNPDSKFIGLHICLVYPFDSKISTKNIFDIFSEVFYKTKSFEINLKGISISYELENNYLFLNVDKENGFLNKISEELYLKIGSIAKLNGNFVPHITLAKDSSIEKIEKLRTDILNISLKTFTAKIQDIYSKIILENEKGVITLKDEIKYTLDSNF